MPDAPLTLWLTDRSRWKTGLQKCPRERYLNYHAGSTGYGWQHESDSVPLATGTYVHEGLGDFHLHLQKHEKLPDASQTRAIIVKAQAAYEAKVVERGFRGVLAGPHTDETIAEQKLLISGLLWAARINYLPWLHERYRVVEVEQERLHLLDCTCGAGALPIADHLARECAGPALMLRADLLCEKRDGTGLAYFEFKTTGWERMASYDMWELDPQLGIGTLDLQARYGKPVNELYVVTLFKGYRAKDRSDPDQANARKKQQSALCQGYLRAGNPPLMTDDWLPSYEWLTNDGETKRASRAHKKTSLVRLAESDWPVWTAYHANDPEMTPEECWVRSLPTSVLEKVVSILGPMNPQEQQLQAVRRGMLGEEQSWQGDLWTLYEMQQGGMTWASEDFQNALDALVPQSWACRSYGKEHQCQFVPICHRHQGWQDPVGLAGFKARRPHHTPELDQAVARGLIAADAAGVEEE